MKVPSPVAMARRAGYCAGTPVAQQQRQQQSPSFVSTRTDETGAVHVVASAEELGAVPTHFENVDGRRIEDGRYAAFVDEISGFIPKARQYTDPVRTLAFGTDASFYRLNPKIVLSAHNEEEVARVLPVASKHGVPVTFRAAGTSLSGQAITDSVLLRTAYAGRRWRGYEVHGDGSAVTVQPGLIGGEVNRILAAHASRHKHPVQYKLGPDPASIDAAMVGGILANNASGMCCGVHDNSYNTIQDLRIVFADGAVLDTSDPGSRAAFLRSHKDLCDGLTALAARVQADEELAATVRRKFAIKCTTGYSLNALVDFPADDPIEIIKHLMVGSEGTLGFVSQVTYTTVPEWPYKSSAFLVFPDVVDACRAAAVLKRQTPVDAAELFDRQSLAQFEQAEEFVGLVPEIVGADPGAAGLLLECRGQTQEALNHKIDEVQAALAGSGLLGGGRASEPRPLASYHFTPDPKKFKVYWDARKSLLPVIGGAREPGTTSMLEDVCCPVERLGEMTRDLGDLMTRHGYGYSIFGHALEGNVHIVFAQGFRTPEEVGRFASMFDEMMHIVAKKHGGSLKGEHGTGRNVAPYVELEWGAKAYDLMWELKSLFDPGHILNPGVVLNRDPLAHLRNLKPSPTASPLVNRCMECGFCEPVCPSRDVTLTPRQRIVVFKELFRLRSLAQRTPEQEARLKEMAGLYEYVGKDTCAADGMCQERCPVEINTGELTKHLRAEDMERDHQTASRVAMWLARNFGPVAWTMNKALTAVSVVHGLVGAAPLRGISALLNRWSGHMMPEWNEYMPRGAASLDMHPPKPAQAVGDDGRQLPKKVVYVPACVTRIMGPSRSDPIQQSVPEAMLSLFHKAGYEVIYPEGIESTCCGMMFGSRGFTEAGQYKGAELEAAVLKASQDGAIPVVVDTSSCLAELRGRLSSGSKLRFSLYDPIDFIRRFIVDEVEIAKVRDTVAVHTPCSSKKLGLEDTFMQVAGLCANQVVPTNVPCCGMAGDRGMRYPELSAGATQHFDGTGCSDGYSTSRTCEMNLAWHSGVQFRGLVHLVDEAAQPKKGSRKQAGAQNPSEQ